MTGKTIVNYVPIGFGVITIFFLGANFDRCVSRQPDPPPVIRESSVLTIKDCVMTGAIVDWYGHSMTFWIHPEKSGDPWKHVTITVDEEAMPPWAAR